MMYGKCSHRQRVGYGDREREKAIGLEHLFQIVGRVELAKGLLDSDLPGYRRTDVHDIRTVADRPSRLLRKLLRVVEPPEQGVSVEQEHHAWSIPKAWAMSAGNSSKSSAIR